MEILAHRANLNGPSTSENTPRAVEAALQAGFGLETDIRWGEPSGFYIAHDPAPALPDRHAALHAALWRDFPQTVALNIKEPTRERELLEFLRRERVTDQVFLFDMELVEVRAGEMARRFRSADAKIKIAARISDRNEPLERALSIPEANVAWLDEFDRPWVERATVETLKRMGKTVISVSPELHGFPVGVAVERWAQLRTFGVDGICTDYPFMLRKALES